MIKTIIKRWLSRLVPALTVIMAAVGVFHSVWRVVAGIAFVGLGMACIVKCIFWPDKDEEPVTQPVQPAPTMMPMPTVPTIPDEECDDEQLTPTADSVECWLREQQGVSFECACGASLTIRKRSSESIISGVFCQACDEQHYICWSDGVVRHGKIEGE